MRVVRLFIIERTLFFFFFFFQAEDGIRDKLVTGVQTCALPILGAPLAFPVASGFKSMTRPRCMPLRPTRLPDCPMNVALARRAGNQESSNPECCTSRTIFNFQSCGWRG